MKERILLEKMIDRIIRGSCLMRVISLSVLVVIITWQTSNARISAEKPDSLSRGDVEITSDTVSTVNLDEVVIKGSRNYMTKDGMVFVPTRKEKENKEYAFGR